MKFTLGPPSMRAGWAKLEEQAIVSK